MNAPFALAGEIVRPVDLGELDECARIEGFVAEQGGSVFHRPAWLKAIEVGAGQKACGLISERNGEISGWLPLTEVHSPFFGRALVSSGFAVEGGILAERQSSALALAEAATELVQRMICSTVELRGGPMLRGWDVRKDSHCGFVARLAEDDEAQLQAIPRK